MILDTLKKNSGFTLIELMVATTLFTFIMLMGVGSLIVSSNSAKASQKLRTAVDNVNFAMESMTRELRTGTYYECEVNSVNLSNTNTVADCLSGGNIIAFIPQQVPSSPLRVAYELNPRGDGTNSLQRCEYINSATNCADVVSTDVNIQSLTFYVRGSSLTDGIQPSVKILVKGVVTLKGVDTPFILQSMASQRSTEK